MKKNILVIIKNSTYLKLLLLELTADIMHDDANGIALFKHFSACIAIHEAYNEQYLCFSRLSSLNPLSKSFAFRLKRHLCGCEALRAISKALHSAGQMDLSCAASAVDVKRPE